jgi:hypothetical protein
LARPSAARGAATGENAASAGWLPGSPYKARSSRSQKRNRLGVLLSRQRPKSLFSVLVMVLHQDALHLTFEGPLDWRVTKAQAVFVPPFDFLVVLDTDAIWSSTRPTLWGLLPTVIERKNAPIAVNKLVGENAQMGAVVVDCAILWQPKHVFSSRSSRRLRLV